MEISEEQFLQVIRESSSRNNVLGLRILNVVLATLPKKFRADALTRALNSSDCKFKGWRVTSVSNSELQREFLYWRDLYEYIQENRFQDSPIGSSTIEDAIKEKKPIAGFFIEEIVL